MAEAEELVQQIVALQNSDGGWPYSRGVSWTEPTSLVVLALSKSYVAPSVRSKGITWLVAHQKQSGGWSPSIGVTECTSVSAVATLALLTSEANTEAFEANVEAGLRWIAGQVYPDDLSLGILLAKTLDLPPAHAPGSVPWYPGTAGWVAPTALTATTLMKAARQLNRPHLEAQARLSCSYLLSRRCSDEGWNHGGSATRSENALSYPETTGIALLALRSASVRPPDASLKIAEKFVSTPGSIEALSWLQLALSHPGAQVSDPAAMPKPRNTRDLALRLIALNATVGYNPFLEGGAQS